MNFHLSIQTRQIQTTIVALIMGLSNPCHARMSDSFIEGFASEDPMMLFTQEPVIVGGTRCVFSTTKTNENRPEDFVIDLAYRYLERENLTPNSALTYSLNFDNCRKFKVTGTGTTADHFYCEQAIWQASHFSHLKHPETSELRLAKNSPRSNGYYFATEKLLFEKHPDLKGHAVVMPVIPYSASELSGVISANALHSLRNLNAIDLNNCKSSRLQSYQSDWDEFLSNKKNLDRTEILNQGARMLLKYRDIFLL